MDPVKDGGAAGTPEAPAVSTTTIAGGGDGKPAADGKPAVGDGPAGGKPAGEKPAAGAAAADDKGDDGKGGKAGDSQEKPKAPESYSLKVPAGHEHFLDATDLKKFEAEARANGLSNEQAQAVIESEATRLAAVSAEFRAETEADQTYGGDHLVDTQRFVKTALDRFAPTGTALGDALRRDLEKSGFGNKLSVIAYLANIGKAMSEDRPGGGSGGGGGEAKTAAEKLYPGMATS